MTNYSIIEGFVAIAAYVLMLVTLKRESEKALE
jgi:hypothetical protein